MQRRSNWLLVIGLVAVIISHAHAGEEAPRVAMETSQGTIVIQLNPQAAPQTAANFLAYVESGFYDNTIFHRVIKGFMIQGGGFSPDMRQKTTRAPIANEADNGLKNVTGTIAMARTRDPHSATAQFFINAADNGFLDHTSRTEAGWGYCVFGRVIEGMETVRAIETVPTTIRGGHRDVPSEPVVIKRMAVLPESDDR